jgi:hypothetical protein
MMPNQFIATIKDKRTILSEQYEIIDPVFLSLVISIDIICSFNKLEFIGIPITEHTAGLSDTRR